MTQNQTVQISDSRRAEFNQILDALENEWFQNRSNKYDTINLKLCPSFAEVEKAAPEYRVDFLIHCIDLIRGWGRNKVWGLGSKIYFKGFSRNILSSILYKSSCL